MFDTMISRLDHQAEENWKMLEDKLDQQEEKIKAEIIELMDEKLHSGVSEVAGEVRAVQSEVQALQREVNTLRRRGVGAPAGAQAGPAIKFKPPVFDGTSHWRTYLLQFEAAAEANGWTDEEKALSLILALRSEALDALQDIPETDRGDFEKVVHHLELRYGDRHLTRLYDAQLMARSQKASESLQQFGADVVRLVRLANPEASPEMMEKLKIDRFIKGLRDGEARQALWLANHKLYTDVLAHALQYEAAKKASLGLSRAREFRVFEGEEHQCLCSGAREQETTTRRSGRTGIRCWSCHNTGHLMRDCPRRSRQASSATQTAEN